MRCKHAHSEAELRNGPEITRFLVEHDIQPEHFKTKATRDKGAADERSRVPSACSTAS
jgi:hypothetical protein